MAKLTEKERLSIVANYMGTPEAMYSSEGQKVWSCELNSYGKVRNFQGEYVTDCPFRYQGQYHDSETGLYYNRFRYYSPDEGVYISQDPIRLNSGISLYSYVSDTNGWVDIFGLIRLYRGMKVNSGGRPIVYSGPSGNGNNAANSLGVRPREQGMSTNIDPNNIQSHRKPESYGGTLKDSDMFSIDSEVLSQYGLQAVDDGTSLGHHSIETMDGVNSQELGDRLAQTEEHWESC